MSDYYILSLRWTKTNEEVATWWAPACQGYVYDLDMAGRYSKERVEGNREYFDNRQSTFAIPCEVADRWARRFVPSAALTEIATEVLGEGFRIVAPFVAAKDDNGEDMECEYCERPLGDAGPSRLVGP